MLLGETIAVAFQSIRANKLRAALTMLGIIIGVGAVITMVALGSGAQKAVEDRIDALGANLLTVYAGQMNVRGVAQRPARQPHHRRRRRAAARCHASSARRAGAVQAGAGEVRQPEHQRERRRHHGELRRRSATTPSPYGRMFTQGDDESRQRYAVLGSQVPEMLGANPAAMIGQTVSIRGIPFEIIGILSEKGSQGFQNPDEQILIPLQTARYRVFGTDRLRSITVEVAEGVPLEQGMVDMERVLRREHKIRPARDNDFMIRNQHDFLATQQAATQMFTTLLAGIAAVSLLVGGIGIMNIMLVSVTERTREIGVRKALGATKLNILLQFLIEALVLCLSGGTHRHPPRHLGARSACPS